MALWPAQKNLGTLIAYSAAMMLGTQFWHAHSGGLALAWYLPLLLADDVPAEFGRSRGGCRSLDNHRDTESTEKRSRMLNAKCLMKNAK